jgi:MFS family permease
MVGGLTMMGIFGFAIYITDLPAWLRFVCAVVMSFSGGFVPSTIFGWIPAIAPRPDLVGTISGIVVQCSMMGQVIGPPALAFTVNHFGWGASPWFVVASCAIPITFVVAVGMLERRKARNQANG